MPKVIILFEQFDKKNEKKKLFVSALHVVCPGSVYHFRSSGVHGFQIWILNFVRVLLFPI